MAVILMEGFDHLGSATQLATKGWAGGQGSLTSGRFSGQAFVTAWQANLSHGFTASSTIFVGFACSPSAYNNAKPLTLTAGGAWNINVSLVSSGGGYAWRVTGPGGTIGTSSTIWYSGWHYVELKVVVGATTGAVEMRLNGSSTPEFTATNVNTGAVNFDGIMFGDNNITALMDDIYVANTAGSAPTNTFLGEVRIETLAPNGNGANTAWTGTYTDIDDSTSFDSDTTYISSNTPGDRETATLSDLSVTAGTVFAVQTNLIACKDNAGGRTVAPVLRIGGVNYDGTTTGGLTASYLDYTQLYDRLDPSGAAWTVSTVNAMEAGVKEVG